MSWPPSTPIQVRENADHAPALAGSLFAMDHGDCFFALNEMFRLFDDFDSQVNRVNAPLARCSTLFGSHRHNQVICAAHATRRNGPPYSAPPKG